MTLKKIIIFTLVLFIFFFLLLFSFFRYKRYRRCFLGRQSRWGQREGPVDIEDDVLIDNVLYKIGRFWIRAEKDPDSFEASASGKGDAQQAVCEDRSGEINTDDIEGLALGLMNCHCIA